MGSIQWPYFDPEYETLSQRIHPPSVDIDNDSSQGCTLVKVESINKQGILLEVVQTLTDLDLVISKAYISSDGSWFMDIFHVTDRLGNKVTNDTLIDYIKQTLSAKRMAPNPEVQTCLGRLVGVRSIVEHTAIELIGTDRPGLISDISAVLTNLECNVVGAKVWTHNRRLACVLYVADGVTRGPIKDSQKLSIKQKLLNIMKTTEDREGVKTDFGIGLIHTDRRLHQMMFADRDYGSSDFCTDADCSSKPHISIDSCPQKDYSVVHIQCQDRPKLLFDTVCTLTDMQYVVFHGNINSDGPYAIHEYYIRHSDGCTLDTDGEKHRVRKCLEAAIERRVSQGPRLELCTTDRIGCLSEVTRIFRENGLSVSHMGARLQGNEAFITFNVTNWSGGPVDMKVIDGIRNEIGKREILVKDVPKISNASSSKGTVKPVFSLGSLLKLQWERLSSLSLVK